MRPSKVAEPVTLARRSSGNELTTDRRSCGGIRYEIVGALRGAAFAPIAPRVFAGSRDQEHWMVRSILGGTLDDTSWLRPVVHVWTRSKQPWIVLPESDQQFDTQPLSPKAAR
jgi:hypothetical protein